MTGQCGSVLDLRLYPCRSGTGGSDSDAVFVFRYGGDAFIAAGPRHIAYYFSQTVPCGQRLCRFPLCQVKNKLFLIKGIIPHKNLTGCFFTLISRRGGNYGVAHGDSRYISGLVHYRDIFITAAPCNRFVGYIAGKDSRRKPKGSFRHHPQPGLI